MKGIQSRTVITRDNWATQTRSVSDSTEAEPKNDRTLMSVLEVCQKACKVAPAMAGRNSSTVDDRAGQLGPLGPKLHNTGKWTAPQMVTALEPFWAPSKGYILKRRKGRSPLAKYFFLPRRPTRRCTNAAIAARARGVGSERVFPPSIWHLSQTKHPRRKHTYTQHM